MSGGLASVLKTPGTKVMPRWNRQAYRPFGRADGAGRMRALPGSCPHMEIPTEDLVQTGSEPVGSLPVSCISRLR